MPKETDSGEPVTAIIRAVQQAPGGDVSAYDPSFLLNSAEKRRLATGLESVADYGDYLAAHREEAELFCRSLHIAYSDFFRNPLTFALLEQVVLPGLAEARKKTGRGEIRVWSAGCAAGQEAWSVAILLEELTAGAAPPLSYRIFATDHSEPDLALARAGVYSRDAVGNVRSRHLRNYFSRQGEAFAILPRLRERVDFSAGDLLDATSGSPAASIYGDFDLVLCCNVLFYYQPAVRQRILDKLCRALAPGGYLMTGEAERDWVAKHHGLRSVTPPAAVFQKQRNAR